MIEVKETKEVCCPEDVENRLYHAFEVMRCLPPVKPQGYFNIFLNIVPEIINPEDIKPVIRIYVCLLYLSKLTFIKILKMGYPK